MRSALRALVSRAGRRRPPPTITFVTTIMTMMIMITMTMITRVLTIIVAMSMDTVTLTGIMVTVTPMAPSVTTARSPWDWR